MKELDCCPKYQSYQWQQNYDVITTNIAEESLTHWSKSLFLSRKYIWKCRLQNFGHFLVKNKPYQSKTQQQGDHAERVSHSHNEGAENEAALGVWVETHHHNQRQLKSWWRHQVETFSALLTLSWWESTGHRWIPLTKASDAELWCFLWYASKQMVEQTIETPVICETIREMYGIHITMATKIWFYVRFIRSPEPHLQGYHIECF